MCPVIYSLRFVKRDRAATNIACAKFFDDAASDVAIVIEPPALRRAAILDYVLEDKEVQSQTLPFVRRRLPPTGLPGRERSLDRAEFPEFDRGLSIAVQADDARALKKEVERLPLQGVELAVADGRNLSLSVRSDENIAVLDPGELLAVLVINVVAHSFVPCEADSLGAD